MLQPDNKRIAIVSDLNTKADIVNGKIIESQIPSRLSSENINSLIADGSPIVIEPPLATQEVDGLMSSTDKKKLDDASSGSSTGSVLAVRTSTGGIAVPAPTNVFDATRKDYVDSAVGAVAESVSEQNLRDLINAILAENNSSLPANPSGGSGGLKTDRTNVSFTATDVSSTYHIYGTNISAASDPVGLVIHLHGDGAEEYSSPTTGMIKQYNDVAKAEGMLFVAPLTPDDVGTFTWWEDSYSSYWLAELLKDLYLKYNIDKNRVWFTGYSGGAEVLTYAMLHRYSNLWTGGGAIMLGGGGATGLTTPTTAISQSVKDNFQLHWVVGGTDSPASGGDDGGCDALASSLDGYNYYNGQGFVKTSRTILPGLNHFQSEIHGPPSLATHLS